MSGSYDLVMAFEMIHDLARPVEALTTMRRLGKPDAVHLVMDEKVGETFESPTENPVERLMYAAMRGASRPGLVQQHLRSTRHR